MDELRAGDRIRVGDEIGDDVRYEDGVKPGDCGTVTGVLARDPSPAMCVYEVTLNNGIATHLFGHELELMYRPDNDPTRYERSLL